MEVVATALAVVPVDIVARGREDPLPAPFFRCVRIFSIESVRKGYGPEAVLEVDQVLPPNGGEMLLDRRSNGCGQRGVAILIALAGSDDELIKREVETTFALSFLRTPPKNETHPAYMNWDQVDHRERLLSGEMPSGEKVVLLDEIHKYARWRGLVKGLYDTRKSKPLLPIASDLVA